MAREPYKPLWTNGIYTAAKENLPEIGKDDGTLYFTTDTHELFYWSDASKQYVTVSGVGSKTVALQNKTLFPVPGVEGTTFIDKSTGIKYAWNPNAGSSWVRIGNLQYYAQLPETAMAPGSIFGCTEPTKYGWAGPFYAGTGTKEHKIIPITFIYQNYGMEGAVMQPPDTSFPIDSVLVQLPGGLSDYVIQPDRVKSGANNYAWRAIGGSYIPIG